MTVNFAKGPIKGIASESDTIKCRILRALGAISPTVYSRIDRRKVLATANVSEKDGNLAVGELHTAKALVFDENKDTLSLEYPSNKKRVAEASDALRRRGE